MEAEKQQAQQRLLDARMPSWLHEHAGEFVVFHEGEALGFFPSFDDAYAHAVNECGLDSGFLVAAVEVSSPISVSLNWDLGSFIRE